MSSVFFSLEGRKVWVAGQRGMVGRAIFRKLADFSCQLISDEGRRVDLRRQTETEQWFAQHRPEVVIVAAARVGGIVANDTRPAEFLYDNLMIESNIIEAARQVGVAKILLLGSSCIYPRLASQPMSEESLLSGPLEPTNQWYALAKIAGVKLGQAYRRQHNIDAIAGMPPNLYGPHDNFDLTSGHVIPALLRKIHQAKLERRETVELWGSGEPLREFLYVDDCADALVFLLQNYTGSEPINIGPGVELTIGHLASLIAEVVGFTGGFRFDRSKPDGSPRKLLDCRRLREMGWQPKYSLRAGLVTTYEWMLQTNGYR